MKKTTKKKEIKSREELMSLMDNFDDGTLASLTESRETINCPHCKKKIYYKKILVVTTIDSTRVEQENKFFGYE